MSLRQAGGTAARESARKRIGCNTCKRQHREHQQVVGSSQTSFGRHGKQRQQVIAELAKNNHAPWVKYGRRKKQCGVGRTTASEPTRTARDARKLKLGMTGRCRAI